MRKILEGLYFGISCPMKSESPPVQNYGIW